MTNNTAGFPHILIGTLNEKRYKNLLNSADITEPQYNAVVEAHNKRKVELTI